MLVDEKTGEPVSLSEHAALMVADGRVPKGEARAFVDGAIQAEAFEGLIRRNPDLLLRPRPQRQVLGEDAAMAAAKAAIDAFTTTADGTGEKGGKVRLGDAVAALEARLAEINRFNREGGSKKPDDLSMGERAFLFHRDIVARMVGGQGMRATTSETVRGHVAQMLKHVPGITYESTPIQRDSLALMDAIGRELTGPAHGASR